MEITQETKKHRSHLEVQPLNNLEVGLPSKSIPMWRLSLQVGVGIVFFVLLFAILPLFADAATISRPMHHTGLVGYWNFDLGKEEGTTIYDLSGNGNDGTLTNATGTANWVNGKFNNALDFDGDNDQIDVPNDASLIPGTSEWTIAYWIKTQSTSGIIMEKGKNSPKNRWGSLLMGGSTSCQAGQAGQAGAVAFREAESVSAGSLTFCSNEVINDGEWHHLVFTRGAGNSSTTNVPRVIYTDGVATLTSTTLDGRDITSTRVLGIGYKESTGDSFFRGSLDEIRIYNRALSAGEVERLFNLGKQKLTAADQTGLVGWWTFDEGDLNLGSSTAEIVDRSGNGNTGDWVNHATTTVIGKLGEAIDFDGSNDYIDVGTNDPITSQSPFTISLWAFRPTTIDVTEKMFSKGVDGSGGEGIEFGLSAAGAGRISFIVRHTGIDLDVTGDSGFATADVWMHLVVTWDGTVNASGTHIYVDGSEVTYRGKTDATETPNIDAGQPTFIAAGRSGSSPTAFFEGKIDDVRVYNRALNADEVLSLYKTRSYTFNSSQNNKVTDGLVGLWSFDGPDIAGVTAYDSSSSGYDGTLTDGPTKTIGVIGQALEFDGDNDYVNLGISDDITNQGPLTISAWVYRPTTIDVTEKIFSKGRQGAGSEGIQFGLDNQSTGRIRFKVQHTGTDLDVKSDTGFTDPDTWMHLVVTWDGTITAVNTHIYRDGVEVTYATQTNATESPNADSGEPTFIAAGRSGSSPTAFFEGKIDDVRVYNRVLSADEIQRLYNIGR